MPFCFNQEDATLQERYLHKKCVAAAIGLLSIKRKVIRSLTIQVEHTASVM